MLFKKRKEVPMRTSRFAMIASCAASAALVSACAYRPTTVNPAPVAVIPAPSVTTVQTVPASVEYGRITNIEYFPGGVSRSGVNVPGAIVGGIAGAAAGNALSGGRDAATVLGGAAGAAIGSQVGRGTTATAPDYRITLQTDTGAFRTYDVPSTGDLRIGDRIRVENGVITRP
jgi:outer membrane lipoprotein SlyB